MDYKADRDHGHHVGCKVRAMHLSALPGRKGIELLLTRMMRAFNQAKSTSTSLSGHSGRARLGGVDSRAHMPLLCQVAEDVLVQQRDPE